MVLVTKAVGDLLGVKGIAEETIRFNGYPFLEKNDHVYDAPGWYLLICSSKWNNRLIYRSIPGHAERHLYSTSHRYDARGDR